MIQNHHLLDGRRFLAILFSPHLSGALANTGSIFPVNILGIVLASRYGVNNANIRPPNCSQNTKTFILRPWFHQNQNKTLVSSCCSKRDVFQFCQLLKLLPFFSTLEILSNSNKLCQLIQLLGCQTTWICLRWLEKTK